MDNKLISILMPVYRTEKYVAESVESILNQTYKELELILIFEFQDDPALKIIEQYRDNRISKHFFNKEQRGISEQLNFGISIARGDLIARMDADDIAMPDKFEKQFNYLMSNPDIGIIGTNAYYINEKGEIIYEKKYPQFHNGIEFMMPIINSILHPAILTYKKIIFDAGGYLSPTAEDHDLYLRLLLKGYKFYNLQEPLFKYRIIEKDEEFHDFQRKYFYESSVNYLNAFYESKKSRYEQGECNLRLGMLEYYWGKIHKARKYFLKSFFLIPSKCFIIFRYFIFTLLGGKIFKFLRKKNIPQAINIFAIKRFGIDSYKIKNSR